MNCSLRGVAAPWCQTCRSLEVALVSTWTSLISALRLLAHPGPAPSCSSRPCAFLLFSALRLLGPSLRLGHGARRRSSVLRRRRPFAACPACATCAVSLISALRLLAHLGPAPLVHPPAYRRKNVEADLARTSRCASSIAHPAHGTAHLVHVILLLSSSSALRVFAGVRAHYRKTIPTKPFFWTSPRAYRGVARTK